jgi:hypothetical protein
MLASEYGVWVWVLCYDKRSVGQSVLVSTHPVPRTRFSSVRNTEYVWQLRSLFRGTPSLRRGRVCLLYVPLALASAVFLGRNPLGLATVFYCFRFETSLFVASYDSQGHGGGIRPRLHTGQTCTVMTAGPLYIASAQTAQKTPLPTVTPLLRVTQPLPNNGWFWSTVLALSKYATIILLKFTLNPNS